jgi:hypothetical protein
VHEHFVGRGRDGVGEDVRMPAHHLLGEGAGHVVDVEGIVGVLSGDGGVEQHLPEQITELFAEVAPGPALDRLDHLVRLLDEVRHEVAVGDRLRPHAAVAHGAHGVGRGAQRILGRGLRVRTRSSIHGSSSIGTDVVRGHQRTVTGMRR